MAQWIDSLLDDATDLTPSTKCQYRSALRYWAAWYHLRYQEAFPLALPEPAPIGRQIIEDFIADHTPKFVNSQITTSMSSEMAIRLRKAGFNRGVGCPSASTTTLRYAALKKALEGLDQWLSCREFSTDLRLLRAQWVAETAAAGIRNTTPLASQSVSKALVQSCDTGSSSGAQDAAFVLLCQRLTVRQVMALKFEDLTPGVVRPGLESAGATCIAHNVRDPATAFQKYHPLVLYIGWEADIISIWGTLLQEQNASDIDPFIEGPETRGACRELWARRRFKEIVNRAGLDKATMMSSLSPGWFQHSWEKESRGNTPIRIVAEMARITEESAYRLGRPRE